MKIRSILFGTVAAVAFAGSADAAHFHGWYVGVEGGANWLQDNGVVVKVRSPGGAILSSTAFQVQYDTGWAGIGTVG